jgi:hypothetical protein
MSTQEYLAKLAITLITMAIAAPLTFLLARFLMLLLPTDAAILLAAVAGTVWLAGSFLWTRRWFDGLANR